MTKKPTRRKQHQHNLQCDLPAENTPRIMLNYSALYGNIYSVGRQCDELKENISDEQNCSDS